MKEAQPTVRPVIGRLAPSPTGYLHLGNAWAFLCAWLGARSAGGRLILRIEDIDPQRSKTELIHALREDLRWLGLDWDAGPGQENLDAETPEPGPYLQSLRLKRYAGALAQLERRGLAYQCFCTRKELRSMAGAPQAGDAAEGVYTGRCRGFAPEERAAWLAQGRAFSWRLRFQENLRPEFLRFRDLVYGEIELKPEKAGGDFAICRSDGVYAYQLAVVLDDIAMGVTQVARGVDILASTPRQLFLYDLFGAEPPEYAHVPLVLDHEGERLAKRHASISLRGLREAGVKPRAIIGWLAKWSGLHESAGLCSPADLLPGFSFSNIRKEPDLLPPNMAEVLKSLSG